MRQKTINEVRLKVGFGGLAVVVVLVAIVSAMQTSSTKSNSALYGDTASQQEVLIRTISD